MLRATLVFDRGMVSDENLALLEAAGIKYISAMDRNQLEGLTEMDFSRFGHLEPERLKQQVENLPGFIKLNATTFYRDVKLQGKRRYLLCFNPELFQDQRRARCEALEAFRAMATAVNAALRRAKKSRQYQTTLDKFKEPLKKAKLSDVVHIRLHALDLPGKTRPIRTYQGSVLVDESAMRHVGRLDGFWLLVTNHSEKVADGFCMPASEAIVPYQEKVVIESCFRDIKSFIDIEPVYVWTEAHVKAHYTLCVLAHLINRTLSLQLHRHRGDLTKEIVSHPKLYDSLSGCQIDRIEVATLRLSTHNMTRPTPEQKELLQRVGLPNLLSREVVETANANNISGG